MKLNYCVACGEKDAAKLEHHHLVPRFAGGSDDPTNLITLCFTCHAKAHGYERHHVRALTAAGIARAKANGKKSGNPRMRTRDPEAIRELARKQTEIQLLRMIETPDVWLPIVQQMRPFTVWNDIAKAINTKTGLKGWEGKTLRRAVSRLASEGLADPALLKKPQRIVPEKQTAAIAAVAEMLGENPDISLRKIAAALTVMGIPNTKGGLSWHASSVNRVLKKARAFLKEQDHKS